MSLNKRLFKKNISTSSVKDLESKLKNEYSIVSFFKQSNGLCDFIISNKKILKIKTEKPPKRSKTLYKGNVIGKGFGGIVYSTNFKVNGIPVVIKKAKVNTKTICQEDNEFVKLCNKYIAESTIGSLLNTLYTDGKSPNFIRTFYSFMCPKTKTGYQVIERMNGTLEELDKIIKKNGLEKKSGMTNTELKTNAIIQAIVALYVQQEEFGMTHSDLKPDNVFIKVLTSKDRFKGKNLKSQKYLNYNVDGIEFKIKNPGFLAKIGDFGQSRAFKIPTNFTKNLQIKRQIIDEKGIRKFAKLLPKDQFIVRELIRQQFRAESIYRPTIDLQFLMNNLLFDKAFKNLPIVQYFFNLVEEKLCRQRGICEIDRKTFFIPETRFKNFPTSRFPTVVATITPEVFLKEYLSNIN